MEPHQKRLLEEEIETLLKAELHERHVRAVDRFAWTITTPKMKSRLATHSALADFKYLHCELTHMPQGIVNIWLTQYVGPTLHTWARLSALQPLHERLAVGLENAHRVRK